MASEQGVSNKLCKTFNSPTGHVFYNNGSLFMPLVPLPTNVNRPEYQLTATINVNKMFVS